LGWLLEPLSHRSQAVTTPTETAPHKLLTGGLKPPPDYNRLQQVVFHMKRIEPEHRTGTSLLLRIYSIIRFLFFRLPLKDQWLFQHFSLHRLSELPRLSEL